MTIFYPGLGSSGLTLHDTVPFYNVEPEGGEPARFGFIVSETPVLITPSIRDGEDYGVTVNVDDTTQSIEFISSTVTVWGDPGAPAHAAERGSRCLYDTTHGIEGCDESHESHPAPFVLMPTSCPRDPATGQPEPLHSSIEGDSWLQANEQQARGETPTLESFGSIVMPPLDGCNQLPFSPSIQVEPDISDASSPSGLRIDVHVPQEDSVNPEGLAEGEPRGITVALPAGVQINPSGGDGLHACSESLVGYRGTHELETQAGIETPIFAPYLPGSPVAKEHGDEEPLLSGVNFCPDAAKIGTVRIHLPILPNEVEGAVYLASQNENPFGGLIAMYIVAEDPSAGVTAKLPGEVQLCETAGETIHGLACEAPGQLIADFEDNPQAPFEDAEFHFFGGERAPLATPSRCGSYTTRAAFTPWSAAPGEAPRTATSTFQITSGPNGSPCPGASLPFAPTLNTGAPNNNAGQFTALTTTMSREDGEQNLSQITLHYPPGLLGDLTGVRLCPEEQANDGTCGPESLIGETTVSAGVGPDPVSVRGGKVYLTGPYHGASFGLSVVAPVKAGPFDLEHDTSKPNEYEPACDCIVVRAKVEVDPHTAALQVTTNSESEGHAIPHFIDGIPVQIKRVNVLVDRPKFTFNPTSCNPLKVEAAIASDEGATHLVETPFQDANCRNLAFEPKFAVSTSGRTSRADGASLSVKLTYPNVSQGTDANIRQVKVELPKALPSRLSTLQKACTQAQFQANPAGCPAASSVGHAKAITPLIPVPLEGPAYFVSNGGEAFPNLIVVLQGYGVTIDLVGDTFINKAGVTSSTFKTVPDAPVGSFELTLPEGHYSALAATGNLCKEKLAMPTEFLGQNGALIKTTTKIAVTGCGKSKKASHKKKHKGKRKGGGGGSRRAGKRK